MLVEINPSEISGNPFDMIGKQWMLITAGDTKKFNMMTASWGGIGVLWNKNVAFCFIRPTRYTIDFVEAQDFFTISFFDEKYRNALNLCGSKSGRDVDKVKETGLKPVLTSDGIYFEEAKLVLKCRKIYFQDINPSNFLDDKINLNYENKDYHKMFVGEIIKSLAAEK